MSPSPLHTYTVPGEKGSPCSKVTAEQLRAIKSEQQLQSHGTLTAIAIRPATNQRTLVPSALITKQGLTGDKGPASQYPHPYLAAVSLMRSDVSDVLGGAQVPGDNLHVEGMSLATDKLAPGDLIVISEPNNKEKVKSIFLMTDYPHTACARLEARVGTKAFNFINGMGEFEEEENIITALDGQKLNGPQQRSRGVLLGVLEEGIPSVGDMVFIERGQQKDERIAKLGLIEFCKQALLDGKEAEEKFNKKENIVRNSHKSAYLREKAAAK
jgi:hypothetical protein